MPALPLNFLRHGSAEPPPRQTALRAGSLEITYEAGDLRHIRLGSREIIRRIYAAVRDANWGTVPGTLHDERIETGPDWFRIDYRSMHRRGDIEFEWRARILGTAESSVVFEFEGMAGTTFLRNRIGCCVLHPIRECCGKPVRIHRVDGSVHTDTFPTIIASGQPVPGFQDMTGIDHEIEPGLWAGVRFTGEVFETEDQRNWTDASFKTYSTPIRLPFPAEIAAGTRLRQTVEVRLLHDRPVSVPRSTGPGRSAAVYLDPGSARIRRLPDIGLGAASHDQPLSDQELTQLSALSLAHLRVDLHLADPGYPARLRRHAREAADLGVPLEMALHFPASGASDLRPLFEAVRSARPDIVRIMVFQDGRRSTPAELFGLVRGPLADFAAPIGAGTDADLYQLNLERPPGDAEFIAWSMNPQVHAFDLTSLAETPEAAAQQITSVAAYFPGVPLVVSPITLKPRFNPVASGVPMRPPDGELPPEVDARQLSLFGAGWTLAMLGALTPMAVESLTWFETSGPRGVLESAKPALPASLFPSVPGGVFPLYHVFADLAEFTRGEVLRVQSGPNRTLATLAIRQQGRVALWIANLTPETVEARITGLPGTWRLRFLDDTNVLQAMSASETWRSNAGQRLVSTEDEFALELRPFALVRLLGALPLAK